MGYDFYPSDQQKKSFIIGRNAQKRVSSYIAVASMSYKKAEAIGSGLTTRLFGPGEIPRAQHSFTR